jgi:hypothetical protein
MDQKKILTGVIESTPLTIFVFYIHLLDIKEGHQWLWPYLLSSIASVSSTTYLMHRDVILNRLFLGINCYFLSGLIGLVFNLTELNQWYGQVRAVGMLYWIIACGILCTLFSPFGFLGVSDASRKTIIVGSMLLLLSTMASALIASLCSNNLFWGEWFPFVLLFSIKSFLVSLGKKMVPRD